MKALDTFGVSRCVGRLGDCWDLLDFGTTKFPCRTAGRYMEMPLCLWRCGQQANLLLVMPQVFCKDS